jgi:hypothetical protein
MPFDESLSACEDKEWAFRALAAGWTIAVDPQLRVSDAHRRQYGLRHLYRRTLRESEAIASFATPPRATAKRFLREWLIDAPGDDSYARSRQRLSPPRFTELLAKFHGVKAAVAHTPGVVPRPPAPAPSAIAELKPTPDPHT